MNVSFSISQMFFFSFLEPVFKGDIYLASLQDLSGREGWSKDKTTRNASHDISKHGSASN